MTPHLYAFYGSLRRGLQNHERFKAHLRYRFSSWLKGYQLYSLGDFPFAVRSAKADDKILVEVVEVTDPQIQKQLDDLELGYGYHIENILIEEQPVKIYLFKDKANYPLVPSGDWAKSFRG
jgi:gamma-glutamylcyclotransferase (GGCT)/AIG2-like uncharacterized protein YtfP